MTSRFTRLGDAISQFLNVLLFNGDPNHSVSGDAYRYKRARLQRFIDYLFSPWEDNHCKNSYEHDVSKASRLLREQIGRETNL
jgi:hypothetical protein